MTHLNPLNGMRPIISSHFWNQTYDYEQKHNLCEAMPDPPQGAGDNKTGGLPNQNFSTQALLAICKSPWLKLGREPQPYKPLAVCVNTQPCVDAYRLTVRFMCIDV